MMINYDVPRQSRIPEGQMEINTDLLKYLLSSVGVENQSSNLLILGRNT